MVSKPPFIFTDPRYWREWQLDLVRRYYADVPTQAIAEAIGRSLTTVYQKARKMGLLKSPELVSLMAAFEMQDPNHGGRAHQFQKGIVPANKGLRRPGFAPGRMASTQFKAGDRPHTWVPVGSHRVVRAGSRSREFIVERKVNDLPGPYTVRWKPVHAIVWQEAHGPVPDGHVVVFKPGMKTVDPELITLDRLELVTRRELMERNSFHNSMPPELRRIVQLRGVLTRQINRRREAENQAEEAAA